MKFKKYLMYVLSAALLISASGCSSSASESSSNESKPSEVVVETKSENSSENAAQSDKAISDSDVSYKTMSIADAKAVVGDEDTLFVDLRSEAEYIGWQIDASRGGHIKGAVDFPADWFDILDSDEETKMELERRHIDTKKSIVLYDDSSVDESIIKELNSLGYEDISVLEGGAIAWSGDESLPMEKMEHYELLVYPEWVQSLVDGENPDTYDGGDYKIVELSFGKQEADYEKGHIKGAVHVDETINEIIGLRNLADYEFVPQDQKEDFWNRPDDATIEQMITDLGITKDTTVVIYGPNTTAASRCAVTMKYAGVEDVRILNGGIERWNLDQMPLESGVVNPEKAKEFGADVPANPKVMIDLDDEMKLIDDPNAVIASIRSWPEYICDVSGYTYIGEAGDIANSRFGYAGSDPYHMEDYRNPDNTMFNYHMIAKRWADWGITPDKYVSFHCGTGWRASETYMYASAMGWENISVYDGGWYEWHLREDTPRKTAGIPEDIPYLPVDSCGYTK
jgi:thiosulfate/3-mercaptopyruvate sulfurtransferase